MAHKVYAQGETHLLQVYFQGGNFSGPLYLGLGSGALPVSDSATLDDVDEITTALGYSRIAVPRDGSSSGWDVVDDVAISPEVEWTNTGSSGCWPAVDYVFLTLSPELTVGPNILIAAASLPNTVLLDPSRKLKVIFKFRQV